MREIDLRAEAGISGTMRVNLRTSGIEAIIRRHGDAGARRAIAILAP